MDVLRLQAMLGHAGMDMIQHYAQMVDKDILQARHEHGRNGPAEHLGYAKLLHFRNTRLTGACAGSINSEGYQHGIPADDILLLGAEMTKEHFDFKLRDRVKIRVIVAETAGRFIQPRQQRLNNVAELLVSIRSELVYEGGLWNQIVCSSLAENILGISPSWSVLYHGLKTSRRGFFNQPQNQYSPLVARLGGMMP